MRVLQLCNKPPRPIVDGGCIAMNEISEGLINAGCQLDILTISTAKHPFHKREFDSELFQNTEVQDIFVDTKVNLVDAFSALISSDSYNVSRFFSSDFDFKLIRWLTDKSYDIIHLESLFMTPYIPTIRKLSKAKIILRSHNLEHLIWERMAKSAGHSPKKLYLKHLASRLKKYEVNILKDVDGIASISSKDEKTFRQLGTSTPIKTIPFSTDLSGTEVSNKSLNNELKLFHLGAMNWTPNIEAVNYLIDKIWPLLSSLDVSLNIAGRGMQEELLEASNGKLQVIGEVKSARDFIDKNDVLIVPLISGSGIRVKIIEAMAMGKAVITTSIGAEGIPFTNWENLIIADSPEEFAHAITELSQNKDKVWQIGDKGRALALEHFDSKKVISDLIEFYKSLEV